MTDEERRDRVLRKLSRTGRGETVCLADWEVEAVLDYIYKLEQERKDKQE